MAFQRRTLAAIGVKAPLPGFIEPALATSIEKLPSGERWLHEIKFDGYRRAARRTRADGSSGNPGRREALAHSRRNRARCALYLAPPRLHSEPHMTTCPSVVRTDHFHLPRPRRFSTMSNAAKRSSPLRQVTLRT